MRSSRTLRAAALIAVAALTAGLSMPSAYAEPTPADLEREVADAWERLELVVERFNTTREELRATRGRLSAADAELTPLVRRVDELQTRVGTIAAGVYLTAGAGPANALLTANSPGVMLDQLTMLDHIARGHQREIDGLRAAQREVETQQRNLRALSVRQAAQERELSVTKTTIESALTELRALRARAHGVRATRATPRDANYIPVFPHGPGGTALRFAYQQVGKPYRWAAAGPDAYDCSGLVLAAWRAAGVKLPHSSRLQWQVVTHIGRDQLRPGDLVFYYRDIHHVALYAGEGRIIDAPQPGERVTIRTIDYAPIYGYGRAT